MHGAVQHWKIHRPVDDWKKPKTKRDKEPKDVLELPKCKAECEQPQEAIDAILEPVVPPVLPGDPRSPPPIPIM